MNVKYTQRQGGARWLSGRASDSRARGRGFETYLRRVLSLSKTLFSPKVLVIHRKRWLRPDMTEKLLTGTLILNTNKKNLSVNEQLPVSIKLGNYRINFNGYFSVHVSSLLQTGLEELNSPVIILH